MSPRTVLFLCTGNYYRSRYSEILFGELAGRVGLDWRADSCGLAPEYGFFHTNPMSRGVLKLLHRQGIVSEAATRNPRRVTLADLKGADRIIAVKEAEHRPLLAARFPGWEDRVEYWHVHDIDCGSVHEALEELADHVRALIDELRG